MAACAPVLLIRSIMQVRLLLCAVLLLSPLAAQADDHKLTVVASFSIIADMARQVAGSDADITSIVPAATDAHAYEPTAQDAKKLTKADVILLNGLGFEGWFERLAAATGDKKTIFTLTKGIAPLMHGTTPDPHAWQDVSNAKIYVANIRDALIAKDPAYAAHFTQNAERYISELEALDAWAKTEIAKIPPAKRRAITSHDALGYFAKAYGLELIPAQGISTEGELSAAGLAHLIDQVRSEKVNAIFLENMSNPRLMQQLAEESGAKIGGEIYSDALSAATGDGTTYISLFRHNVSIITTALEK